MTYVDPLYRKGLWTYDPKGWYAVTAWGKTHNLPHTKALVDIMCWRETYEEAYAWMHHPVQTRSPNGLVYRNEVQGNTVMIKCAPFFSLLRHIEWRGVRVP